MHGSDLRGSGRVRFLTAAAAGVMVLALGAGGASAEEVAVPTTFGAVTIDPTYVFVDGPNDPSVDTDLPSLGSVGDDGVETANNSKSSTLPFDYRFSVNCCMDSRHFKTDSGTVCNDTQPASLENGAANDPHQLHIALWRDIPNARDRQYGTTVTWPADDIQRGYCWGGGALVKSYVYYLKFSKRQDNNTYIGKGRVHNGNG
jgi:hypothetical protein